LINPDDPDEFLNLVIASMGNQQPAIKDHFMKCKECRSVLFGCLNVAIRNMMRDPILNKGFALAAQHINDLGHGIEK